MIPAKSSPINVVRVVGAGFTGLACAYFALHHPQTKCIEIYDKYSSSKNNTLLRGASAASAGLLHPLTRLGKEMWKGYESYDKSLELIKIIELESGNSNIIQNNVNIIRKGGFEKDEISDDVIINNGIVINPVDYLDSLWDVIESQSKKLNKEVKWKVINEHDYTTYNQMAAFAHDTNHINMDSTDGIENHRSVVINAMGAGMTSGLWGDELPFTYEVGKNIVIEYPITTNTKSTTTTISNKNNNEGKFDGLNVHEALIRGEYMVPMKEKRRSNVNNNNHDDDNHDDEYIQKLILGATHERDTDDKTKKDDVWHYQRLKHQIRSKLFSNIAHESLWPDGNGDSMLPKDAEIREGTRVQARRSHVGRLPVIGRHPVLNHVWMAGAFGSRGLLYHAMVAELTINAALTEDCSDIPEEIKLK